MGVVLLQHRCRQGLEHVVFFATATPTRHTASSAPLGARSTAQWKRAQPHRAQSPFTGQRTSFLPRLVRRTAHAVRFDGAMVGLALPRAARPNRVHATTSTMTFAAQRYLLRAVERRCKAFVTATPAAPRMAARVLAVRWHLVALCWCL